MQRFRDYAAHVLIGLNVLAFFLVTNHTWLKVPVWLQVGGRFHPLLVHFPIVMLLLGLLVVWSARSSGVTNIGKDILLFGCTIAALTVISGLFLSTEGGYDSTTLFGHRWTGMGVSFFGGLLYYAVQQNSVLWVRIMGGVTVILTVWAGHLGATLTHGEGYLLGPVAAKDESSWKQKEGATIFERSIGAMLDAKCAGCHRPGKEKGNLVLTSLDGLRKGGKHGALWMAGQPDSSLICQRLLLDQEDKSHMPPRDKPQLTASEIKLVQRWIRAGAPVDWSALPQTEKDSLMALAESVAARYQINTSSSSSAYTFAPASADMIRGLNTPFRYVAPVAAGEPALQADFFVRQAFEPSALEELRSVQEQLVSINLTNMPVTDEQVNILTGFANLEKVILNNTDITDATVEKLVRNPKLKQLAVSGTRVTRASLDVVGKSSVKEFYAWNTAIAREEFSKAGTTYPSVRWVSGYVPDEKDQIQLAAPLMMNESQLLGPDEAVVLKSPVPGAVIRYTLDGTDPDSVKGAQYSAPIKVSGYTQLKAKAFRDGWVSSAVASWSFFQKGYTPVKAEMKFPGDTLYPGRGIASLVDGRKGFLDFFRDPTWVGFLKAPLDAIFVFDESAKVKTITISYAKDVGAMTMPPERVQVYGGDSEDKLTLLAEVRPEQPTNYGRNQMEGLVIPLSRSYRCFRIVAQPLSKMPAFRKAGKKDRGWLMTDEILFN